jgi:hypothetical protein
MNKWTILPCVFVIACCLNTDPGHTGTAGTTPPTDAPVIRVLSPPGGAYLTGSWSSGRLLIALEISEPTGVGLMTYDSGTPRFVEPNHNVDLFDDYILEHGQYMDGRGNTITQILAAVPTENLKLGALKITPPIDPQSIPKSLADSGFMVPTDALLETADFNFQVKNKNGDESKVARLVVAIAPDLYRGPFLPPATGPENENPRSKNSKNP